jgi:hypothetical protein
VVIRTSIVSVRNIKCKSDLLLLHILLLLLLVVRKPAPNRNHSPSSSPWLFSPPGFAQIFRHVSTNLWSPPRAPFLYLLLLLLCHLHLFLRLLLRHNNREENHSLLKRVYWPSTEKRKVYLSSVGAEERKKPNMPVLCARPAFKLQRA